MVGENTEYIMESIMGKYTIIQCIFLFVSDFLKSMYLNVFPCILDEN